MSLWTDIEGFFKKIFGHDADIVKTVLSDIAEYIQKAQPIVAEIETEIKPFIGTASVAGKVLAFLQKYEPDADKAAATVTSLTTLPASQMLEQLAVAAVQTFFPGAGVLVSDLITAVNFAYSIFKSKLGASAPVTAAKPTPVV